MVEAGSDYSLDNCQMTALLCGQRYGFVGDERILAEDFQTNRWRHTFAF